MKDIVAVASGKGGVGKSTVAVNLAVALANQPLGGRQLRVALIDVDFYGPSIPTLMGGGNFTVDHEERIVPPQKWGVKYISLGFFLKNQDDPVIWRGPMFTKGISQLFDDVSWGDVDICIVDLPPGTGDAQLSLAQNVRLTGALLVTTPQEVALSDVRKALNMFRKVNVPVLGVIENMAGFITPGGEQVDIFGKGGGENLARQYQLSFYGSIPLEVAIREGGDRGEPIALISASPAGGIFRSFAQKLFQQLEISRSNESITAVEN